MDKEKVIKKIKQGAPATSAIVVAACIGVSLSGYQAPVYEAQAQTKETKTTDARKRRRQKARQKVLLIWQTESIKEQEPVMPAR